MVDEDSDLESDDDTATNGSNSRCGGSGGLSLPHTYGSQLSQPSDLSQDGTIDTNTDAPGPRLVSALRRAGQAVDCAICGDDLSPPYVKHSCPVSGPARAATVPMRAHLHCLGLSFITRAEQEESSGAGSAVLSGQSVDVSTNVSKSPVPWVPTRGRCPACCEERSWAEWLRITKYRFPLRRQSADEGEDEEATASGTAGRGGETSETESEGEGNGFMFSDTDTEPEAADAAASSRSNNERFPPACGEIEAQESLESDSSDSEIDTEQTLAERLGRRLRQKKRRRAPKPPLGVCILSPVADLGDREEAEAASEDEESVGEHTDEAADTHNGQPRHRRFPSTKEEISLLSPCQPELSMSSPGPDLEQMAGDQLDSHYAGSQEQHTRHLSSSEDEDEAALLESDSDCVVLMTQNEHS